MTKKKKRKKLHENYIRVEKIIGGNFIRISTQLNFFNPY